MSEPKVSRRKGHPGRPYPQHNVESAIMALNGKSSSVTDETQRKTLREAASEAGVLSHSTVVRWEKQDMSVEARAARLKGRGHKRNLQDDEEVIVAGYVVSRHNRGFSTKNEHLGQIIERQFGVTPSASWFTRFRERHRLTLQEMKAMKNVILTGNMTEGAKGDSHSSAQPELIDQARRDKDINGSEVNIYADESEGQQLARTWRSVHEAQLRAFEAWRAEHGEFISEGEDETTEEETEQRQPGQRSHKRSRGEIA